MDNTILFTNADNMKYNPYEADIIFCDYVYENLDFSWVLKFWPRLKNDGVFIAMADYHSQHRFRVVMEDVLHAKFVSHLVLKCEWGNHPKDRFHQCYDDIIIYSNSENWIFDSSKIQVPKKTLTKGLNPSGRTTKQATAWIDDITLTTTAKERVKKSDGHLIRWQKPMKLYDRIIAPFAKKGAQIYDPFAGSGSLGKWCRENGYNYEGVEIDKEIYDLACKNIYGEDYFQF